MKVGVSGVCVLPVLMQDASKYSAWLLLTLTSKKATTVVHRGMNMSCKF